MFQLDLLHQLNSNKSNECFSESLDEESSATPSVHVDIKFANKLDNFIEEQREKVANEIMEDSLVLEEDNVRTINFPTNSNKKVLEDDDEEKYQFKDVLSKYDEYDSFLSMKRISKPILKALTKNSIYTPKPIQSAVIPHALLGRDICASAHTGSGKTLAFLVPIIEKLLHLNGTSNSGRFVTPRAVVIAPTRELAMQIHRVAVWLSEFTPRIKIELVVGGISRAAQETQLRCGADLVVATPGRLIDMVHNVSGFELRQIRYLVLDEADKALDANFIDQIREVVRQCSPNRQLFLFSATMTERVSELAELSLRNPLKIFVNPATELAVGLQQEFIRVKLDRAEIRESMLVSLLCRALAPVRRTIVFIPTKAQCHRIFLILGLLGIKCAELHGNMTQAQRLNSLGKFTLAEDDEKRVDVLVCTDLASRGIDVTDIQYVINYSMPASLDQYIHRVGRTARCGNEGHAISFVHEKDRPVLKKIKTYNREAELKMRKINISVLQFYQEKIKQLNKDIEEITLKEKTAEEERLAELELQRAEERLNNEGDSNKQRYNWFSDMKRKKSGKGNSEHDTTEAEDQPKSKKLKKEDPNKGKPFSKKIKKQSLKGRSKRTKPPRK